MKSFAVPAHNGLTITSACVQADHGGQPPPEQTVDATESPSSRLSMQQGELLSKREVLEHKLAPRPNQRANRPVQTE